MHINIVALNRAWIIRWNIARLIKLSLIVIIIKATCLRVDRAMIFFRSVSHIADILAVSEVIIDKISNVFIVDGWILSINRIIKMIPAVTRVEEWTKAETGVGAAIAAGSHAVKGNWALFVILAIIIIVITIKGNVLLRVRFHIPENIRREIDIMIIISPIRLVIIVNIPALFLLLFW